ncbi:MAG: hypothetical protein SVN78_01200 [Deferribacterota bacterium]|nr:hypothetical protein [Deferribacterota bacterium]
MKDYDKIKEGEDRKSLTPITIFIVICFVILGIIVYIIISLNNQYNYLSEEYAKLQEKPLKLNEQNMGTPKSDLKITEKKDNITVAKVKQGKDKKNSIALAKDEQKIDKTKSSIKTEKNLKVALDNTSRKVNTKEKREILAKESEKKKRWVLNLIQTQNLNDARTIFNLYSSYLENLYIYKSWSNNKNKPIYLVNYYPTTHNLEDLRLKKIELKRKFNLNSQILEFSEWYLKESSFEKDYKENSGITYTLQLLTNNSKEVATNLNNMYKKHIGDSYIIKDIANGITWYKIRCCSINAAEEAIQKSREIESRFNIKPYIIASTYNVVKDKEKNFKYVLVINKRKGIEDAVKIASFYKQYLEDIYITADGRDSNRFYTIKCCQSETLEDAKKQMSNLKKRFNLKSSPLKVDINSENKIVWENLVGKNSKKKKMYVIQLSSHKNIDVAQNLLDFYKNYYSDAHIFSDENNNKSKWYKIRCCTTKDYNSAKANLDEIKDRFNIEPVVVEIYK